MKAIVYAPNDEESFEKRQELFAKIHAEVFMEQLNSLNIPYEEKIAILRKLKAEIPPNEETENSPR